MDQEAKEVLAEEQVPEVLAAFLTEIENLEPFNAEEIKKPSKLCKNQRGIKGKSFLCQYV